MDYNNLIIRLLDPNKHLLNFVKLIDFIKIFKLWK